MKTTKIYLGELKSDEEIVIEKGKVFKKKKFDIQKWALKYTRLIICDNSLRVSVDYGTRTVVVRDNIRDKVAYAFCKKNDKFDENIGLAICYCRLKGKKIPDEIMR